MSDMVYCYPESDVLKNKLNIRNLDRLHEAEMKLTMLRLSDLLDQPLGGEFDLKHLQEIHKYIFQDIYVWAGKIRTVNIAKENMFCKVQAIEIFGKLKKDKYLVGLGRDENKSSKVSFLCDYSKMEELFNICLSNNHNNPNSP